MIHLITGVPGAGKTAFSLWTIKHKADQEGREVFYAGIPNLNLPWASLSQGVTVDGVWEKDVEGRAHWVPQEEGRVVKGVERWMELPPQAIVVIDECQDYFRPRSRSAAVPPFVAELEKHRHRGHDIYLITQKPGLVDAAVKDLAGKHWHLGRKWGTSKPTVYEWETAQDITKNNLKLALKKPFQYPKEVFTWYKSTEVDTHKQKAPWRVRLMPYFFVLGALLAGGAAWKIWSWTQKGHEIGAQNSNQVAGVVQGNGLGASAQDSHLSTVQYVQQWNPRVPDLPYSAPVYDQVTQVAQAPLPVACVQGEARCSCYSQQGTKLDVSEASCRLFVEKGFFNPFDDRAAHVVDERRGPERVYSPPPGRVPS